MSTTPPTTLEEGRPSWANTPTNLPHTILSELRTQSLIAGPLVAMNLAWFAKTTTTTFFLSRLGELHLAGGALGFAFANVTGFSVLNGLCGAMEPICGQAHGAQNRNLLHKTLLMATLLLLLATLPISLLWLNIDKILTLFGQREDIADIARTYVTFMLPDLLVTSFLCPLKAYLSSQGVTLPILFGSAAATALHVPINMAFFRPMGLKGVSTAVWATDLVFAVLLGLYVLATEARHDKAWGGWLDQRAADWARLVKLAGPCCMTTCLEWWCYEILMLLAGRLPGPRRAVTVTTIVFNFDYLVYAVMLSLAVCTSTRVSNELGAGRRRAAEKSAHVSMGLGVVMGLVGGSAMVVARRAWARLFSHDVEVVGGVERIMLLMGLAEVVNFPVAVCGGIVRGTAKPWLGMYASLGGFYLVALPVAVVLAFVGRMGLGGLFLGFLVGVVGCLVMLVVLVMRIDWAKETQKAQKLACVDDRRVGDGEDVNNG
ncbi:MATE efflux family protein 5 [Acorus calamus]|uniref:Protein DETOXIFICATION n=1 Tax=Acorus calamus TaxID=4465 RepID=A0AAV9C930_ACOCL|nr:MATE efflux family protein 5 [Acorus calamus]